MQAGFDLLNEPVLGLGAALLVSLQRSNLAD